VRAGRCAKVPASAGYTDGGHLCDTSNSERHLMGDCEHVRRSVASLVECVVRMGMGAVDGGRWTAEGVGWGVG